MGTYVGKVSQYPNQCNLFFLKPYQIEYHFSTSLFLKTQPPFFRLQNPKGNEQNICNALHVVAVWVLKAKATSRRRETTLRFFLIGIYTKVGCEKNETHFIERVFSFL